MTCANLKDKVAVVTGGSRGIGKAVAVSFARSGAKVVICARNVEELRMTSEFISIRGGTCSFVVADVSDEKQVDALASKVLESYNRVDILVNNAGTGRYKPLIDSTLDDWNSIINTNLRGPFLCSRAFAPYMIRQKRGLIINVVSGAGRSAFKNLSIYCASKFGLIGLTESMRKEFKEFGIEVLYICPGYVKTGFFKNFSSEFHLPSNAAEPEDIAKEILIKISHQRKLMFYFNEMLKWFIRR